MAKKKILMINPMFPLHTYWSFSYALPYTGKKTPMTPLGLITVAAMLPKDYEVRLIDLNFERLKDRDLKWADLVMTSSMNVQQKSLEEITERAKRLGVPVAAGGPYPTQYYDEIKSVDHLVLREAESGTLKAFIRDFENGQAKKAYVRKNLRKKPDEREIDEREFKEMLAFFGENADIQLVDSHPKMNLSPIPRYDLLKIEKYHTMAVQNSRGCPFSCDFCSESALYGHETRLKQADRFIEELSMLYELGYRGSVFVVDDNFIGNKRVKNVLKEMKDFQKKHNYPFTLYTEASINLAWNDELMGLMRDAGFNMVFVGIESPDEEVLKSMGKKQNLRMPPLQAVRKIQEYGMEVSAGFVIGNDNDPPDICDKIFDFCQEAGIPMAMAGLLIAARGSPLYERLRKEGRLRDESSGGNNTHEFRFNFDPLPGKNEQKIIDNYKRLNARLYDRTLKNYTARCITLNDHLGPNPKPARDIGYTEIRALVLSLLFQSYFRSYSKNYRNLLRDTYKRHRSLFPEAVSKAIMGIHPMRVTQDSLEADSFATHLHERVNYFKEKIEEAWQTKKAKSQKLYQNLIKEKDKLLVKAKKKINKFPSDYQPKLIEAYQNMEHNLALLFKNNAHHNVG